MVASSIITTTNLPQYSAENTEIEITIVVTAHGGTITDPSFGISLNSGVAADLYDGWTWTPLNTIEWRTFMQPGTLADGGSATFNDFKIRFPSVSSDSLCSIDFIPGHYAGGINVHDGPIVTKTTMVTNQVVPTDNTMYYILAAIGVAAAAAIGFMILRRKR